MLSKAHYLYRFIAANDEVLYVGITADPGTRILKQHFGGAGHLPFACYQETDSVEIARCESIDEAKIFERFLVNKLSPRYNTAMKNGSVFSFDLSPLKWEIFPMDLGCIREKLAERSTRSAVPAPIFDSKDRSDEVDVECYETDVLDVYVGERRVGSLDRRGVTEYAFSYLPDVPSECAVSLLMPVRNEPWVHRSLHPPFQVSLPEGHLKRKILSISNKREWKISDLNLLSIVGGSMIGRLRFYCRGQSPLVARCEPDITFGVSGGFPKYLDPYWIIKINDDDHPSLVLNEYFGLKLAKRMGLPTPDFQLSDDANRIAIRRFDFDEAGQHLGFEDMCALQALNASDKFAGTVEKVLKTINAYCLDTERAAKSREQFYAQYMACMAIRNGDAHLKNFGLVYSNRKDAMLTPVYDMVSMSVYAPRAQNGDALDAPAMSFEGSKKWFTPTAALKFGRACLVSGAQQKRIGDKLVEAMYATANELSLAADDHPEFRPVAKRMLELWSQGVALHSESLSGDVLRLAGDIATDEPAYKKRQLVRY